MARVIVYLREQEISALQVLAQREYRALKAQAALIIREELERLGLIGDQIPEAGGPESESEGQVREQQ